MLLSLSRYPQMWLLKTFHSCIERIGISVWIFLTVLKHIQIHIAHMEGKYSFTVNNKQQ